MDETEKDTLEKLFLPVLFLMSLPFIAVGLFMLCLLVHLFFNYFCMRFWEKTDARILHVKQIVMQDSDAASYGIDGKYEYTFNGKIYYGSRISLHGDGDNISDYQKEKCRFLADRLKKNMPVDCYVNPRKPEEAILFRELRPQLVILKSGVVLAFTGGGLLMMFSSFSLKKRRKIRSAEDIVTPDRTSQTFFSAGIILWNLISWPMLPAFWDNVLRGDPFGLLAIAFPLIGLAGIPFVITVLMRRLKFGNSLFRMKSVPGVIGGYLEGVIEIPVKLEPLTGFDLELSCIQKIMDGEAQEIIWHVKKNIAQSLDVKDEKRSFVPVRFGIPHKGVEEKPSKGVGYNTVIWRLEAKAELPGLNYKEKFEVPVRKTAESSPDFADFDKEEFLSKEEFNEKLEALRIRMEKTGKSETIFIFPALRNISVSLMMTLPAITMGAVSIFLPSCKTVPSAIPLVSGFIAVCLFFFSIYLWFHRSRVIITERKLQLESGVFFTKHREYDRDDIKTVLREGTTRSGAGKLYYDLKLELKSGAKKTLAKMIGDRKIAERLADEMNKLINT